MDEKRLLKKKEKLLNSSNKKCLAEVYNELGDFYYKKSNYEKALFEYKNSASTYFELKMKLENAKLNRMIGEVYMFLTEFKKALKHNEIYLETVRELDNKVEEQRALATLGRLYLLQGQSIDDDKSAQLRAFKNAEKSFMKSLQLCENLKGKVSNFEFMDMKARLLLNIGVVSEQLGDFTKAIIYFQKSISICKSQDLFDLLTQCYVTEGLLHSSKYNDHTKAITSFNMALNFANKLENKICKLCEILHLKADALCKLSDFQSAKMILTKAWKMKSPVEEERYEIEKELKIVAAMCYTEDTIITTNSDDSNKLKKLYEKMGDGACLLKNYQKGVYFYSKMLEYAEKCGETGNQLIPIYISLYQTYKDLKEFDKALEYSKKEYDIIKSVPKEAFKTLLNIAEILLLAKKPYTEIEAVYKEAHIQASATGNKKNETKCLKLLLNVQTSFGINSGIENIKNEISKLDYDQQISDDSSEDIYEGSETPDIGDDICLEDLTDFSDDENYDKNLHKSKRKRGKTFFIKKNNKGETQLHQACISGNTLLVSRLLSQGHPVNIRDNAGWLPIHESCIHGHKEVVEMLIANGAHINDRGGNQCDGITPLCDAAFNGHLDVIELLLDNGASPVIKTDSGENPLVILQKWHKNNKLDSSENIFYETLCSRMQNSLKKMGDIVSNDSNITTCSDFTNKISNSISTADQYSSLIDTNKKNSFITSSPHLRRDQSNVEGNSSDSDNFENKQNVAVHEYKNAIKLLRKKSIKNFGECNVNDNKKMPAILSSDDVDDDWLENDFIPLNKKRRNINIDSLNPAKRKSQLQSTSPLKNKSCLDNDTAIFDGDSCEGENTFSSSYNSNDNDENFNSNDQINRGRVSRKYKQQVSLMRVGFSRNKCSRVLDRSISFFDESNSSEKKQNNEEPDSTTDNNHSTFSSHSSYFEPFFTNTIKTKQDDTSIKPPISVKIQIQEKTLLIPVSSEKISSLSVDWLIKETCKRFYNLEGVRPTLTLLTNDGALLSNEDSLSVILSSSELVANIINWNLPLVGERYVECCYQFGIDPDYYLKSLLEMSQATHCAEFINLNLDLETAKPIFKSLNHQNTLKSLILCNSSIGNVGIKFLCESLPTLVHIENIDLSGNLIDANGIQAILLTFEKCHTICPHFHSLNLNFNFLSNVGFIYILKLSKFIQFKTLYLRNNFIECTEIDEDLSSLQFIENIDLSNNAIGKKALFSLFTFLGKAPVSNIQIEKMNVHEIFILEEDIFSNLIEINLSRCNIQDSDITQIIRISSKYQNLEKINVSYVENITFFSLKQLLSHDTISHINLEGCLSIFKNIDEFDIQNTFIIGEKKNKLQYLKFSCEKNSIYSKYVKYTAIMWTNYWKEKSILNEKVHGLFIYSRL